jgi:23S rRNA pseudouridine1911/1915/1917 synthase
MAHEAPAAPDPQEALEDDFDPEAALEPSAPVHDLVVDGAGAGERLDKYLALQLPQVSRSRIQRWIADDGVRLNGTPPRARAIVQEGDRVRVEEQAAPEAGAYAAEAIDFPVVYEDADLLVVDKPAGLVVHPGAGNWSGTLLNGLLARDPRLARVPRAGIVHRLDAGTSGLLVVARTPEAHWNLVQQLAARSVVREYWALVAGAVAPFQSIEAALDRDPRNPLRFRVSKAAGARPARTWVRCLAHWNAAAAGAPPVAVSWVACRLDTGRTHQIRVHMESIGHPLVGDPVYRRHLPAALLTQTWMARPALHACRLELVHPRSGTPMAWASAAPPDMAGWMRRLGARPAQLRAPARPSIELPPRSAE